MGFTALDGLPMGTRPGQLDPGVVLYLIEQTGHERRRRSPDLLYNGVGPQGPLRHLQRHARPARQRRPRRRLRHRPLRPPLRAPRRQLAAALGGLDAFVFTAGIGENSAPIRARIAERLAWLGAELDPAANEAGATRISTPASRVALLVVPTDEELMIARHTLALVSAAA